MHKGSFLSGGGNRHKQQAEVIASKATRRGQSHGGGDGGGTHGSDVLGRHSDPQHASSRGRAVVKRASPGGKEHAL